MAEIRPGLDVLALFVASRLEGGECIYRIYGVYQDIQCGDGFWVGEYGALCCGNHMRRRKAAAPVRDHTYWAKVEIS